MLAPQSAITRAKSPEAFRTISEVAAELDVPQHVLRFWESRFAQVKPVKRAGGRRYYRPEDVDLLRGIRALLYREGFTIRGVQKVLRDRGLRHVAGIGRAAIGKIDDLDPDYASEGETRADDFSRETSATVTVLRRDAVVASPIRSELVPEPPRRALRLSEHERARLELRLAELLQLKTRLLAVRKA